jgi:hypothetical protein
MAAALNCGPTAARRYRAVSMQLAAYLDGRYVELRILTDDGEAIAVACPRDSIFALQQHIEQIGRQCPEIAAWSQDDAGARSFQLRAASFPSPPL